MAFDGLVLNAVSNELACLIGGKLQKFMSQMKMRFT